MTFKYTMTLPIHGGDKLRRFRQWAELHLPTLAYSLPLESKTGAEAMTVHLRSPDDRALVLKTMATAPLP